METWHHRKKIKVAAGFIALAISATLAGVSTWSAFSSTTEDTGNAFASGTVVLADNDTGTAMLALSNARPGDSDTACIAVTSSG